MILTLALLNACSTTADLEKTAEEGRNDKQEILVRNPLTLADMLVRVPGVFVDDRGGNTRVTVRGGFPLYVIDGVRVGNSYYSAANAVNVNDIASVEVLKSPTETMLYGRQASNGVILIKTKRG